MIVSGRVSLLIFLDRPSWLHFLNLWTCQSCFFRSIAESFGREWCHTQRMHTRSVCGAIKSGNQISLNIMLDSRCSGYCSMWRGATRNNELMDPWSLKPIPSYIWNPKIIVFSLGRISIAIIFDHGTLLPQIMIVQLSLRHWELFFLSTMGMLLWWQGLGGYAFLGCSKTSKNTMDTFFWKKGF